MSIELKEMILSTIAEMENAPELQETKNSEIKEEVKIVKKTIEPQKKDEKEIATKNKDLENVEDEIVLESELKYLNSLRERFLVLFEGFQAPNNANIEAKIDLTLNFLEYVLSTLDNRISLLEKGKK